MQSQASGGAKTILVGSGYDGTSGVAVDARGNVYVADTGHNAIKKISPPFDGPTHGKITKLGSGFSAPYGVAVDAKGDVFVANNGNNLVQEILPSGAIRQIGSGFTSLQGVAVDTRGNAYVIGGNAAFEVSPPFVGSTHGKIKEIGYEFSSPEGVAVDGKGFVYIANYANPGAVYKYAGPFGGATDGSLVNTYGNLIASTGLGVDPACKSACDIYIAAYAGGAGNLGGVFKLTAAGVLSTFGSGFRQPNEVALDTKGDVFVSDSGHNQVKEIVP